MGDWVRSRVARRPLVQAVMILRVHRVIASAEKKG